MHLQSLLETYGYLAVFVGSMLDGEAVIVLGVFLAQHDLLFLPLVLWYAFLGALVWDSAWFLLGRHYGDALVARFSWLTKPAERISERIIKNPRLAVLFIRFMYGFRHIAPFLLGKARVAPKTFFSLELLGAGLWVGVSAIAGDFLARMAHFTLGRLREHDFRIIIAFGLGLVALLALLRIMRFFTGRVLLKEEV
jgi:membrane protein DedA with SNARE-associated domain